MVDIMTEKHNYVPTITQTLDVEVAGESTVTVKADHFHNILFGGDQLTVARSRGAQHIRINSVDGIGRLEGLIPVCEDWHVRVTLLSVSLLAIVISLSVSVFCWLRPSMHSKAKSVSQVTGCTFLSHS